MVIIKTPPYPLKSPSLSPLIEGGLFFWQGKLDVIVQEGRRQKAGGRRQEAGGKKGCTVSFLAFFHALSYFHAR
ncbi:MAG: hypothetical protein F6K41_35580 [Symploca sp. SIO3E6]|nr:hypothetical protein [Caldora sp. SIO3E6]